MRNIAIGLVKDLGALFPTRFPMVWSVRKHKDRVALTFDDGPTELTLEVLNSLARHGTVATFFVLINQVLRYPDILKEIVTHGHEVGIHGYEHSVHDYYKQVLRCERKLREFGIIPRVLRTPRGTIKPLLTLQLRWRKYPNVLWSFDAHDNMRLAGTWNGPAPDYSKIKGGDIILMHDDNVICIKELPVALASIKESKLLPVTVSELLGFQPSRSSECASTRAKVLSEPSSDDA